jgi:hypothetical protein
MASDLHMVFPTFFPQRFAFYVKENWGAIIDI